MKGDVNVLKGRLKERENELEKMKSDQDNEVVEKDKVAEQGKGRRDTSESIFGGEETIAGEHESSPPPTAESGTTNDDREEYVRTLEDELELVTEQLIEAETKLSQTQAELEEALVEVEQANIPLENGTINGSSAKGSDAAADMNNQHSDKVNELESTIKLLQEENAALQDESKRLKEELELALEELALSKEELEAYEEDRREQTTEFDLERKRHKDEVAALQTQLNKISSEDRSRDIEAESWEEALMASKKETQSLQEEVDQLEVALKNSKADCETLQAEMDVLEVAFDETANREKVESEGQHQALEELLATRSREVNELNEEVNNLSDTNSSLTKMLKDMEDNLKKKQTEIEKQQNHVASASASTSQELQNAQDEINSLKGLLEAARRELDEQRNEVQKVRSSLKEKIVHAQKELTTASDELVRTQSKLIDVEKDRLTKEPSSRSTTDVEWKRKKKMARLSVSHVPLRRSQKDTEEEDTSPESDFYHSHALSRRLCSHKSRSRPRSCSPTTIQRLEGDAERRAATASSLQVECNRLEDQNRMGVSMKSKLSDEIKQLQKQLQSANSNNAPSSNKEEKEDPVQDLMNMDDTNIEDILQSNDPETIGKEVRLMAKKMSAQKSHNAELLTRILKLQGNIQVCCRIRPMSMAESQKGLHEVAQSLSETEVGCFDERTRSWKSYAFDKVWGPETGQKDVFQDVEPMAMSVIDGYNACIFAYGQTGSGKTYTMEGSQSNGEYGISQRTIQKLFTLLQDKAQQHQRNVTKQDDESPSHQFEYKIEVGMLEIYNDEVYDLLDPGFASSSIGSPKKKALDIRYGADKTVEVPGLIKESVNTVSEVLSALDRGNSNRAKAATNLNEHSSRSHMVLRVDVTAGVGEAKIKGSLYLVDLAGSERVRKSEVEGKALKEAQHINKSLSALGNVMEALDRKASHIPYRDSKLTYLLQNSLGGNSRTMMVVNACPHNNSYDETAFALKFAIRVRRINLGSAQKNVTSKNLEETVKNLTSEMSSLSKAKERSESQLLSLKREKERVEDKLSKTSQSRANSKEEMRTLSVLRQTNNDITSRWQKEKIIREEKTAELGKVQEELQQVQRDMRNVKREQESFARQNEDKENTIFQLKKDLRSMKDQLNEEKIRLRRSQVMQSRIPAPTKGARNANTSTLKTLPSQKPSGLMKPSSRVNGSEKKSDLSATDTSDRKKNEPDNGARIRHRVLNMLQEHEPAKVDKLHVVVSKSEGRETELLEKMTARYESGKERSKSVAGTVEATESTASSNDDGRPKSREDKAFEIHMARMKRRRASTSKG
mmetsp:Transcript_18769/g.32992  ORF Transcript_18769/g.32992 Transcript_18769/m.32992 type:complete len:1302 (+) Transcript_18769:3-3908(+)